VGERVLTNRLGLPSSIVTAIRNDPYTRGDSDISVTQLITPAYQRRLIETVPEIRVDASDAIWSLVGQVGHAIVERAHDGTGIAEERLFMPCEGWTVSGQFDLIEDGCLYDFKFTTVWSAGGKDEWTEQLNLLRVLAHHKARETGDERYRVDKLAIIAIFRDWQKSRAKSHDYPKAQVAQIPIDVWPIEQAEAFMCERVKAHQDPNPPPCTDKERWLRPATYAVMKKGLKRAVKLHDTEEAAQAHAEELGKGHSVEHRPGTYARCEAYCDVADQCPIWMGEVPF